MRSESQRAVRAIVFTVILLVSVIGGGVGFTGNATAASATDVNASDLPGSGTQSDPYVITNASELQAMEDDLDAHYRLGNDIDASNTSTWNGGQGFDPIGGDDDEGDKSPGSSFSGTFDGNGHTITGLTIDRPGEDFVGLFGNTSESTIKAVTLASVSVTGNEIVGGIVGDHNGGVIQDVSISGTVTGKGAGTGGNPDDIGGLAGVSTQSRISNVSASVATTGFKRVGGLVGATGDAVVVRDASATGDIKGVEYDNVFPEFIGGLIGANAGSIRNASAGGDVNGSDRVGGLVGWNTGNGKIQNVSASGSVEGFLQTGGLVGLNSGTIERASASGNVFAPSSGGGLVGINSGNITNAWASGSVTIEEDGQNLSTDVAGGLAGQNEGTIEDTFAVGSVSSQEPVSNVTVGGLLAVNAPNATVRDSYWDTKTTNQSDSAGNATALNTSQMTDEAARSNMSGLTYGEVWTIRTNDYPALIDDPKGPSATDDAYSAAEDSALSVSAPGVLGNDSDPDNDPLTATVASGPTNGSLTLNADGSFDYTPNSDFAGTDSFTYNVSDGTLSDTGTVTITVSQVNDPPTANDDSYSASENGTLSVSKPGVLGNDSDLEGDALSATRASDPTNGTLSLAANGSFEYTPNPGFSGTDSFTYNATDGEFNSTATVTIAVSEANDPPTAVNDSYTATEDNTLSISAPGVLENDSDPNGDILNATRVSGPMNGSLTLNADGSFSYTPSTDFTGTDSFTYNATDGTRNDTATVSINVTAVDDTAPIVTNATAKEYNENSYTVRDGDTVVVRVNVSDPDGSAITSVEVDATGLGAGTVSLSETNVEGVYRTTFTANSSKPNAGDGSYILQISATDSAGNSNSNTTGFPITLDNDPPSAKVTANTTSISTGDTVKFNASGSTDDVTFGLFEHRWDFDEDGVIDTTRFFSITETVTHTFSSAGTYTVNLTVTDQAGNKDNTSITIGVNQGPVAFDDSYSTAEDTTLTVPTRGQGVLGNDDDNEVLNATRVSGPTNGTLSLNTNGSFTYNPNQNFAGTDSFTYNATDGALNSTATVTITVAGENDAPTASDDNYTVSENTDVDSSRLDVPAPGVLQNDSDPDGDALSATRVSGPTNGTLSLYANGSFTYTPDQKFVGLDSFTYNASDGTLDSTATVTINVTEAGTNKAPTALDDSYATTENSTVSVADPGVLDNDSDPNGDSLTATVVSLPDNGTLILNGSGGFSYTPDSGFSGTDSFTYNATDGQSNDTATVTITVQSSSSGDSTPPALSNPTLIDLSDGDGYVADGDRIEALVKATDSGGSGLGFVGVDASGFGAGKVQLNDNNNDSVYNATFTVDDDNAGSDGTVIPTFRADDNAGNFNTTVGTPLTLDTTDPVVSVSANNTTVAVGETVKFTSSVSDSSTIASRTWELGDRTTENGQTVTHSYASAGTYVAELTVADIAGNTNNTTVTITVESQSQPAAPSGAEITAPDDGRYVPSTKSTLNIDYNATGVIDSGDVGIVITNATAGNGSVVGTARPGSANDTTAITVPAGTLSGKVTLNVTLVNASTDKVYAADLVNLTPVTAPTILGPADDTYDPDAETVVGTFHNANGVIVPGDVAVRLVNVTANNGTVVARNTSVPIIGEANLTISAGSLDGNVTLRAELYNTSTGTANASTLLNFTETTGEDDETDGDGGTPAPAVLVPPDDVYNPTTDFTIGVGYNATGFVDPADIEIRFRNATANNGTRLVTATPGAASGNADVTIPADALAGNVTINVTLANGTTDAVYASGLINLTAATPTGGGGAPAAPAVVAPSSDTYNPNKTLNFTTFHNATGVIAPADVGVRLVNATAGNGTVVATNTSVPVEGEATLRVPAGKLSGDVTLRTELYNTSTPSVVEDTDLTNLTVGTTGTPSAGEAGSVLASKVTHVGGTRPDMANISLRAEFSSGLLQVQLKNGSYVGLNNGGAPGGTYELEGLGADNTTRLRVNVTVANFTPRVLIGSAHDVTWTRTRTADGNWTISITGSPAEVHSYFNSSNSGRTEWDGTKVATQSQNQTITYAVDSLSTISAEYRDRMNGSVLITDAQTFGSPQYNATANPDRVELHLAAPHYETDGTVNKGFFEAYLPPSLLTEWNVTASELVGTFKGTRRPATVSATANGGARIEFNVTYSDGTAAVTYNQSTQTDAGGAEISTKITNNNATFEGSQFNTQISFNTTTSVDGKLVNITESTTPPQDVKNAIQTGIVENNQSVSGFSSVASINVRTAPDLSGSGESATLQWTLDAANVSDPDSLVVVHIPDSGSPQRRPTSVTVNGDKIIVEANTPSFSTFVVGELTTTDSPRGGSGGGGTGGGGTGGGGTGGTSLNISAFSQTTPLAADQVDPDNLQGVVRVESTAAENVSVELLRTSRWNYSLAITGPESASNVTFYLQAKAISSSQNISDLTMYLNGEQHNFIVDESAGPGKSPWVGFKIPHFSTQTVSFTSDVELSNATVSSTSIQSGESVIVEATLENTGSDTETVTLNLTDNGSVIAKKDVTIDPDTNKTVRFEPTLKETGDHELGISGLSAGTVTVKESDGTSSDAPGFGMITALLAVLLAVVFSRVRR